MIILSGCILYLDKIFLLLNITVENTHGWKNTENYIWHLCQTISPIMIMYGMYLRAYYIALIIPLFCYVLQYIFVMDSSVEMDSGSTWFYVIGSSIGIMIVFAILKWSLNKIGKTKKLKIDIMEELIRADDQILSDLKFKKKKS